MKKYRLTRKPDTQLGDFDTKADASTYAQDYMDDNDELTIFDFNIEEVELQEPAKIQTYEDACEALGVEPMDEQAMTAAGFRPDEIARRKLEAITAALNEGWKPDWNDKSQAKYVPWFWVEPRPGQTYAGLAFAYTSLAPTDTFACIGSRLCFKNARVARYAAEQFTDLYALILVENY